MVENPIARIAAATSVFVAGYFAVETQIPHEVFANEQTTRINRNQVPNQTTPGDKYCRPNSGGFNPDTGQICLDYYLPNPTPVQDLSNHQEKDSTLPYQDQVRVMGFFLLLLAGSIVFSRIIENNFPIE